MIEIGKPFEPSTILKEEEIDMTEIAVSCGGGKGVGRWEVYTEDSFDLNSRFITVKTNRDEKVTINTMYIVQTRPVKVFKLTVKNNGNSDFGGVGTVTEYYYLIPEYEKFARFVDQYTDNSKLKRISFR